MIQHVLWLFCWSCRALTINLLIFRSKEKQIFHTYVPVSIELQNLYLVPQNIQLQLIFGQLVVSLQNSFWVRLVFLLYSIQKLFFFLIMFVKAFLFPWNLWFFCYLLAAIVSWRKCSGPACRDYQGMCHSQAWIVMLIFSVSQPFNCWLQVLGTPTREEIRCMNPSYTDFRFPQIKAHPWHKVVYSFLWYVCHPSRFLWMGVYEMALRNFL